MTGLTCHTYYPHRQMSLVDLPGGCKAWACHEIERAIFPGRYRETQGRRRSLPEAQSIVPLSRRSPNPVFAAPVSGSASRSNRDGYSMLTAD